MHAPRRNGGGGRMLAPEPPRIGLARALSPPISGVPQCSHAARRSLRRPGRQPRRLPSHVVHRHGPGARAVRAPARGRDRGHDRGRAGAADRHGARPDRPLGLGCRRARPHRARRRPAPGARGRGGHPARRQPSRIPRRPVPPRGHRQPRLRGPHGGPPDGRSQGVPAGPLPAGHRAADRPGHRRVLPGGAAGGPAARDRPPARLADPRHPLRWRPLADRDGPPLPGHDADRDRVRAGFRGPGPGGRRGSGPGRPDHHRGRRCHRRRTRGPGDAGLLPVRAPPAAGPRRGDPLGMGRPQARWLARRPRLVPADGSRGAPDPPQRAARGHAARRAPGWDAAGHALRGAGLVRGRGRSTPELIDLPSGASAIVAHR